MSVPPMKRQKSTFEVMDNATKVIADLLRFIDKFGSTKSASSTCVGKWEFYDGGNINVVADLKCKNGSPVGESLVIGFEPDGELVTTVIHAWVIDKYRDLLWNYTQNLMRDIRSGNSINATTVEEYYMRRKHQSMAIADCYNLIDVFTQLRDVYGMNLRSSEHIVDLLNKEVVLLLGWRKRDNKIYDACVEKEAKRRFKAEAKVRSEELRL